MSDDEVLRKWVIGVELAERRKESAGRSVSGIAEHLR